MQQYINKFQVAINDTKTEVNLNFLQEIPVIPFEKKDGESIQTELEPVSNLVMSFESAQELCTMLNKILEKVDKK